MMPPLVELAAVRLAEDVEEVVGGSGGGLHADLGEDEGVEDGGG